MTIEHEPGSKHPFELQLANGMSRTFEKADQMSTWWTSMSHKPRKGRKKKKAGEIKVEGNANFATAAGEDRTEDITSPLSDKIRKV